MHGREKERKEEKTIGNDTLVMAKWRKRCRLESNWVAFHLADCSTRECVD